MYGSTLSWGNCPNVTGVDGNGIGSAFTRQMDIGIKMEVEVEGGDSRQR